MKKTIYCTCRKAQTVLEYSFLLVAIIGALLGMQAFMKRAMQGQYQAAGDQIGGKLYAYGLTDIVDHFESNSRIVEWKLPAPTDIIKVKGSFYQHTTADEVPLTTNYPGEGWIPIGSEE